MPLSVNQYYRMAEFDIVKWLSGRVGYYIPEATLENIVLERGLQDVTDFADLSDRDKDLTLADLLFYMWTSPTSTASETKSHGDFTHTIGSQQLTDKRNIYNTMIALYRKWGDPKAELAENSEGGCGWMV